MTAAKASAMRMGKATMDWPSVVSVTSMDEPLPLITINAKIASRSWINRRLTTISPTCRWCRTVVGSSLMPRIVLENAQAIPVMAASTMVKPKAHIMPKPIAKNAAVVPIAVSRVSPTMFLVFGEADPVLPETAGRRCRTRRFQQAVERPSRARSHTAQAERPKRCMQPAEVAGYRARGSPERRPR